MEECRETAKTRAAADQQLDVRSSRLAFARRTIVKVVVERRQASRALAGCESASANCGGEPRAVARRYRTLAAADVGDDLPCDKFSRVLWLLGERRRCWSPFGRCKHFARLRAFDRRRLVPNFSLLRVALARLFGHNFSTSLRIFFFTHANAFKQTVDLQRTNRF